MVRGREREREREKADVIRVLWSLSLGPNPLHWPSFATRTVDLNGTAAASATKVRSRKAKRVYYISNVKMCEEILGAGMSGRVYSAGGAGRGRGAFPVDGRP